MQLDLGSDRIQLYRDLHHKLTRPDVWSPPPSDDPRVVDAYLRDWARVWHLLGVALVDLRGADAAGRRAAQACFAESGRHEVERYVRADMGASYLLDALFAASTRGATGLEALGRAHLSHARPKRTRLAHFMDVVAHAAVGDTARAIDELASLRAGGPLRTSTAKSNEDYWRGLVDLVETAIGDGAPRPDPILGALAVSRRVFWKNGLRRANATHEFFATWELGLLSLSVRRGWKPQGSGASLPALPLELLALPPVEVSKVPPREPQRPEAEWCAAVAEEASRTAPASPKKRQKS